MPTAGVTGNSVFGACHGGGRDAGKFSWKSITNPSSAKNKATACKATVSDTKAAPADRNAPFEYINNTLIEEF
jgi:hypothetical protein